MREDRVSALVSSARENPADRHSAIDYAQLGARLESEPQADLLIAFSDRFRESTDDAMRTLATFARFKATAVKARLKGDIERALNAERNAETIYERNIKPGNRW